MNFSQENGRDDIIACDRQWMIHFTVSGINFRSLPQSKWNFPFLDSLQPRNWFQSAVTTVVTVQIPAAPEWMSNEWVKWWSERNTVDYRRILGMVVSELVKLLWFRLIGRVKWQSKSNTCTLALFRRFLPQLIFRILGSFTRRQLTIRTRIVQLCKRLNGTDFHSSEGLSACIACIPLFEKKKIK